LLRGHTQYTATQTSTSSSTTPATAIPAMASTDRPPELPSAGAAAAWAVDATEAVSSSQLVSALGDDDAAPQVTDDVVDAIRLPELDSAVCLLSSAADADEEDDAEAEREEDDDWEEANSRRLLEPAGSQAGVDDAVVLLVAAVKLEPVLVVDNSAALTPVADEDGVEAARVASELEELPAAAVEDTAAEARDDVAMKELAAEDDGTTELLTADEALAVLKLLAAVLGLNEGAELSSRPEATTTLLSLLDDVDNSDDEYDVPEAERVGKEDAVGIGPGTGPPLRAGARTHEEEDMLIGAAVSSSNEMLSDALPISPLSTAIATSCIPSPDTEKDRSKAKASAPVATDV
jgi:hypothetical protein